jgi:hypothetical protein
MKPAMNAPSSAQLMLRAAWQWRRNDGRLWALQLYGLVALLIYVVPAGLALAWLPARAAAGVAGVLLLAGLASVWGVQFSALLRLDHPHALQLVPGHRHAIHRAALGLWAVMVASAGVLAGVGAAALGLGDLAASARLALAAALGTGLLLLVVAAGLRWWWVWVVAGCTPTLAVQLWQRGGQQVWATVEPVWQTWALGTSLLLLAVLGALLAALVGQQGARHAQAYRQREQWRQAVALFPTNPAKAWAAYGRWGAWMNWPGQALADAWLRRCLARPSSVMARAEVVLHGRQHWVGQLVSVLMVQTVLGLALLVTAALTGQSLGLFIEHGRVGISVGLGFVAVSAVTVLPMALWRSRREQALLVLLPGMPRGAALNRALAWRQWRHSLLMWLGLLPALAALAWAGHGLYALAWVGVALPLSAALWRDHSGASPEPMAPRLLPAVAYMVLGMVSMWLLTRHPGWLAPWLAGLLALTAALLAWRWRVLQRLPAALPVGRLA